MNFHHQNKYTSNDTSIYKKSTLTKITQDIEIKNLSFNYEKFNSDKLIDNLNFNIKSGSIILLKGRSGSGKSTFLDILSGLLIPDEGDIKINNESIHNYTNLHEKITSVSQKNILITDTIKQNILFFKNNINEEYFKEVTKKLNVDNFVSKFEKKYDTLIENSGENLSGGQTQRICIARALVRQPEILILDEITSSLDEKNEREIFDSIFEIMKGKTIIISIHKNLIDDLADEIYQIDSGNFTKIK